MTAMIALFATVSPNVGPIDCVFGSPATPNSSSSASVTPVT